MPSQQPEHEHAHAPSPARRPLGTPSAEKPTDRLKHPHPLRRWKRDHDDLMRRIRDMWWDVMIDRVVFNQPSCDPAQGAQQLGLLRK
jgi:hypothetical protein